MHVLARIAVLPSKLETSRENVEQPNSVKDHSV